MLNRQKLGRGLISSQADSDRCDLYHGEEVGRELFVAGYNTSGSSSSGPSVEAKNPVPDDLQAYSRKAGRIRTAMTSFW